MTDEPNIYTAVFERDPEGMWLAELVEEPRVHTYGRTLGKARANVLEAAAVWFDIAAGGQAVMFGTDSQTPGPGDVVIVEDIRLPPGVRATVNRARQGRERAAVAQAKAAEATRSAAQSLVRDAKLSTRDAAEILGLSHQRVQQLVDPIPAQT